MTKINNRITRSKKKIFFPLNQLFDQIKFVRIYYLKGLNLNRYVCVIQSDHF